MFLSNRGVVQDDLCLDDGTGVPRTLFTGKGDTVGDNTYDPNIPTEVPCIVRNNQAESSDPTPRLRDNINDATTLQDDTCVAAGTQASGYREATSGAQKPKEQLNNKKSRGDATITLEHDIENHCFVVTNDSLVDPLADTNEGDVVGTEPTLVGTLIDSSISQSEDDFGAMLNNSSEQVAASQCVGGPVSDVASKSAATIDPGASAALPSQLTMVQTLDTVLRESQLPLNDLLLKQKINDMGQGAAPASVVENISKNINRSDMMLCLPVQIPMRVVLI